MRHLSFLGISCFMLLSCSTERKILDNTVTYSKELEAVAAKIFRMHTSQTFIGEDDMEGLRLTDKESRLIRNKIGTRQIFVRYNDADTSVIRTDSLVVFKKGNYYGRQYYLIVDMRIKPRENIECTNCEKLTDRIYYMYDHIPMPMM